MAMDILDHIKQLSLEIHPQLIEWRRHLHQYPELSYQEHNTSKFISKVLQTYKIPAAGAWHCALTWTLCLFWKRTPLILSLKTKE